MSQEPIRSRVSDRTQAAIDQLEETHNHDTRSDAIRHALNTGLNELGFLTDGIGITPARRYTRESAKLLAYVGATLFVISAFGQAGYLLPGLAVTATSLGMAAVDRWVLTRVEPAVTSRIPRIEVTSRGRAK